MSDLAVHVLASGSVGVRALPILIPVLLVAAVVAGVIWWQRRRTR